MKKLLSIAIIVFLGTTTAFRPSEFQQTSTTNLKGTISISGAFALYPLAVKWGEEFSKLHPSVKFDIQGGGAGKGMTDVLSETVNIAMLSRDVRPEETQKGAILFPVAKDAVVATYNTNNPLSSTIKNKGVSKVEFAGIWINQTIKTWGKLLGTADKENIKVYTRSDAAGAAESWSKYLGGTVQEDLKGIAVFGDPGLLGAVAKEKYAIGFNNIGFVYDLKTKKINQGIGIVPIDINANGIIDADERIYDNLNILMKAIATNKYPSPPARQLFFVTKNKPNTVLEKEFLKWVLSEGQKYVNTLGYVRISKATIDKAKLQIK